jgi:oxygen-independent coproporphyrinogen-3 oxidase
MTLAPAPYAEPFALYVHWPWCLSKCPYCDFNSRAINPAAIPEKEFRDAITAELNHYASRTNGRKLSSIYFGGGTPSLMSPQTAAHILDTAERLWGFHFDCEITLEANPTSIEAAKFRAFREAGVNRVSVGVQALIDADLQALGREHSAVQALRAVDIAGAIFDRFTFDLIYARPGQGPGEWEDELAQALALGSDHLSLYQLTIEPGTEFFRRRVLEASEDLSLELDRITQDMTVDAGLPLYEVSNHARPGSQSRHNLTYWTGGDYVGIGPGAHGRIRQDGVTSATHQIADPARWLAQVQRQGDGTAKVRALPALERAAELLLTGLRLPQGVSRERFHAQSGLDIRQALDPQGLETLEQAGLVELNDSALCVTPQGRLTLNAILERLLV